MFSQGRRRHKHKSSAKEGGSFRRQQKEPQLPTHYHHHQSPSTSTCNNFLLGGHYYPGKDKKRRHLRRRTWWHRWFCSSPGRVVFSSVVFGYILLWNVVVPSAKAMLEFGKTLSGQRNAMDDTGLEHLRSIREQKAFVQNLQKEREELLHGSRQMIKERMKLYKQIVPQWYRIYHGNDDETDVRGHEENDRSMSEKLKGNERKDNGDVSRGKDSVDRPRSKRNPKDKRGSKKTAPTLDKAGHQESKNGEQHGDASTEQEHKADALAGRKVVPVTVDARDEGNTTAQHVQRTLQNIDSLPSQSSCPSNLQTTDISTTLVVQSSLDRVWIMEETCSRWKDPIVAVVYLKNDQAGSNVTEELKEYETKCPQLRIITWIASANEKAWDYPVNILRNIGLDAVKTSHILVVDIDFVPSLDLHEVIRETLQDVHEETKAVVVPAFERAPPEPCEKEEDCAAYLKGNSSFIPHTLDDLRGCVSDKRCSVFQQKVNLEGHYSTNSKAWLKGDWYEDVPADQEDGATSKKRIKTLKCFHSLRYEPYVVLRWCPASSSETAATPVAPYYDERFHGYGKNKIQLIAHLLFMGYSFGILPRGFIVHNPHPDSKAKDTWNNVKDYDLHKRMDELYPKFLHELSDKYSDRRGHMLMPCKHGT